METDEYTPIRILTWAAGIIILLALFSPISCKINISSKPTVDSNQVHVEVR